jgi:peroxiredoxin family protein
VTSAVAFPPPEDLAGLARRVAALESVQPEDQVALMVFSGSLDRILCALMLATSAAASGSKVEMFFSFWAVAALRDAQKTSKKDVWGKLFGWMLPRGPGKLQLSTMNVGGAGPIMLRKMMARSHVASVEELLVVAAESGVHLAVCETSRRIMGIPTEELTDYPDLEICGAATFLERAARSRVSLLV